MRGMMWQAIFARLSLVVATMDNWMDIAHHGMDVTEAGGYTRPLLSST